MPRLPLYVGCLDAAQGLLTKCLHVVGVFECKRKDPLSFTTPSKGGDAMDEGRFDREEGYYIAEVNGSEITFESWQAYQEYISDHDGE